MYLLVPLSCDDCNDSCCGVEYNHEYTVIDSLSVLVGSIQLEGSPGYEWYDFSADKSTAYEDAAISVRVSEVSLDLAQANESTFDMHFSLINRATACSYAGPEPTQGIQRISIFSDSDIVFNNAVFKAGADLSSFFSVLNRYGDEEEGNLTISDFIDLQNGFRYAFGQEGSYIVFVLNEDVKFSGQTLTFRVHFDDDTDFLVTTDEFIVE